MKSRRYSGLFLVLCVGAALAISHPVSADVSLKTIPDFVEDIRIDGSTELYYLAYQKNVLGIRDNDPRWLDGHFKLGATVELKNSMAFRLSAIYAGTFGEEYYGLGTGDTSTFNADEAYVKVPGFLDFPVDITLGMQRIEVEKGFLISEGNLDLHTAVYANSEKSSPFAFRADIDLEPVTVLAYWQTVKTDKEVAVEIVGKGDSIDNFGMGLNVAVQEGKTVYAGATQWNESFDTADMKYELTTCYIGTDLTFGPLNITGEYARQTGKNKNYGTGVDVDRDASAYNLFLKYSFPDTRMMPWVEIGAYSFSGDDPATSDDEAFNTMTTGFPDWGKFCPGEIFGEPFYFTGNNYRDYMLQAGFMPGGASQIRLQYHSVTMDQAEGFTDDKLYDEINLLFEFFPDEHLYWGVMVGMAMPESGHEELQNAIFGTTNDETAFGVMPFLAYSF
jgi:hypothetical protein